MPKCPKGKKWSRAAQACVVKEKVKWKNSKGRGKEVSHTDEDGYGPGMSRLMYDKYVEGGKKKVIKIRKSGEIKTVTKSKKNKSKYKAIYPSEAALYLFPSKTVYKEKGKKTDRRKY